MHNFCRWVSQLLVGRMHNFCSSCLSRINKIEYIGPTAVVGPKYRRTKELQGGSKIPLKIPLSGKQGQRDYRKTIYGLWTDELQSQCTCRNYLQQTTQTPTIKGLYIVEKKGQWMNNIQKTVDFNMGLYKHSEYDYARD